MQTTCSIGNFEQLSDACSRLDCAHYANRIMQDRKYAVLFYLNGLSYGKTRSPVFLLQNAKKYRWYKNACSL
jgi:hypothetical protein